MNANDYPFFYAAVSKDNDNIMNSSSGGIFYELCKLIIKVNGVVYGAEQISATNIEHRRAETLHEVDKFRRSKYLRSHLDGCFIKVKEDLESNRIVLFSGVGCQIAALNKYLVNEYDNLITCEVVCHGAPLTEAMQKYIEANEQLLNDKISQINYRDKTKGWKQNCISEVYESGKTNVTLSLKHPVHSLYLKEINLEQGCNNCSTAKLPRCADITLADFWQYNGKLESAYSDKGISLVTINNQKGEKLFTGINDYIQYERVTEQQALNSCRYMTNSPKGHPSQKAFKLLLDQYGFKVASDLCNNFGEIICSEQLRIVKKCSDEYILKTFSEDTQEVIYYSENGLNIKGIITFGSYLKQYAHNLQRYNENFSCVRISDNVVSDLNEVFNKSNKINRVPVVDHNGNIIIEVRKIEGSNGRNDPRKQMLPIAKLSHNGNKCAYINRPSLLAEYEYSDSQRRRINEDISFSKMQSDITAYIEDFKEIFGEKFSEEYIDELSKIPPIIKRGFRYQHTDQCSKYVNVINGCRITLDQPEKYDSILHVYGRCGVFGYAVEDGQTIPSNLQRLLNESSNSIKVVNHGLWGADDEILVNNLNQDIDNGVICKNDSVILYLKYQKGMDDIEQMSTYIFDTTIPFHKSLKKNFTFYNIPGHTTAEGYEFISEFIYEELKKHEIWKSHYVIDSEKDVQNKITKVKKYESTAMKQYLADIGKMLPMDRLFSNKVGAVVVNCNPFTLGHKYLIEMAKNQVDILIVFVVQEDKSYFTFEDRINMVRLGTKNMKDVYVVPSGEFIISALTLPDYFLKEQKQHAIINAANDLEIFGGLICPEFNITNRFVGTEPRDLVTNQYNQQMKKIMPDYGVNLYEIPRRSQDDGIIISAKRVRTLIQLNTADKKEFLKLIPETTYNLISGKYLER